MDKTSLPGSSGSTEELGCNAQVCARERPILFSAPMVSAILASTKTQTRRAVKGWALEWLQPGMFTPEYVALPDNRACPYGQPGDRLWVREAFGVDDEDGSILYWADPDTAQAAQHAKACEDRFPRCRPSIHMPRTACRITLEITSVRVERLHDISEADALAEGPAAHCDGPWHAYRSLWTLINGPASWDANPWVWVVEFKRCPDLQPNV